MFGTHSTIRIGGECYQGCGLSALRETGAGYQTSLPTGGPQSISSCRFSSVMPSSSCSNVSSSSDSGMTSPGPFSLKAPSGGITTTSSSPRRTILLRILSSLPQQSPAIHRHRLASDVVARHQEHHRIGDVLRPAGGGG